MATAVKRKIKGKSIKKKLSEKDNKRQELIQLLSDTTNFEKNELSKMSNKELADLNESMETEDWLSELDREKENVKMEAGGYFMTDEEREKEATPKITVDELEKKLIWEYEDIAGLYAQAMDKLGYNKYYKVGLKSSMYSKDDIRDMAKKVNGIAVLVTPEDKRSGKYYDIFIKGENKKENGGKSGIISLIDINDIIKRYDNDGRYDIHENISPAVVADIILNHKFGKTPQEIYNEINGFYAHGGKTEIKGIGKFVPIAKIKEIIEYFDSHNKPTTDENTQHTEGYAFYTTMNKYSVLGDTTIVDKILFEHKKGKSLMDIHKAIKKLEHGGEVANKAITHAGLEAGVDALEESPEILELAALENGGKSDKNNFIQEIVDQSKSAIEHRYLIGNINEDEYKKRLTELESFAKKRGAEFKHGGKTDPSAHLYFPDDKYDYTNQMLIELKWITVGGRIEDFHSILKQKGRIPAYAEIKKQYGESMDDVYRALLVLDRLENMNADSSTLYNGKFKEEIKLFQNRVRKQLARKGEHTNYLMSKPVMEWDNADYDNYAALKLKHNFADGGTFEKDTLKQLIADGFVNKDHTLTNKGRRIADLHKFCFPIGAHPFSYAQYSVEELYSKPQYVILDNIIYYTDGFLVYELGGHLSDNLRDTAAQNHTLENQISKTISKNLTEYNPYAYCPGVSMDDKVKAGEGFIIFNNFVNSNELYVNSFLYNYIVRHYKITSWMADPNNGSVIQAMNNGVAQAIIMVNANAVGVNPSFTLYDRDKLMGELRNKYTELFIKGKNYKDFIGEWKSSDLPEDLQKPADIENTIMGLQVLIDISDDEEEIKNLNQEIYKLKSLLK